MSPVSALPSLREIVAAAFRYRWPILLAGLVPLLAGFAAAFLIPPQYEAYSRVLVRGGREFVPQGIPGGLHSQPVTTMREIVEAEIQILTSADLLREVLEIETIERLYPGLTPSRGDGTLELTALRRFGEDLVVTPARRTNVIGIGLRGHDPEVATGALRTLLDRFHDHHLRAFQHQRGDALEGQLAEMERDLGAARAARAQYVAANGLFALAEQRDLVVRQREADLAALREAERQRDALAVQAAHLRAELDRQPGAINLQTTTSESLIGDEARRRLAELRERERELLSSYGGSHPTVRAIRAQIAGAEQSVGQSRGQTTATVTGVNPLVTTLRGSLAAAEAERVPLDGRIAALAAAVAAAEARLQRLNADEVGLARMDRRIADLEAGMAVTHQRVTDARVSESLDRARLASIQVIEAPAAFDRPVFPRKSVFVLAGGIVGLISAALTLLFLLTFGNRFLTEETIERMLGAPVVAALPDLGRPRRLGRPAARIGAPAPRLGQSA